MRRLKFPELDGSRQKGIRAADILSKVNIVAPHAPKGQPMTTITLKNPRHPYNGDLFQTPEWQGCIRGLANHPSEEKPFCLSYEVMLRDGELLYPDPHYIAWQQSNGATVAHTMGDKCPEITQAYGTQMLNILNCGMLRLVVEWWVSGNSASSAEAEPLRVGITAHGIVIFPLHYHSPFSEQPGNNLLAALSKQDMSHHQRLKTETGLEACLQELMTHQFRLEAINEVPEIIVELP